MVKTPLIGVVATLLLAASAACAANVGFVAVSNAQFVVSGQPYFIVGANLWQGMSMGMADAAGGDRARLGRELDRLRASGVNHLRLLAASEGPDSEPYRVTPALQPAPGVLNPAVLAGLDYCLA